jgi:hypothetical protein
MSDQDAIVFDSNSRAQNALSGVAAPLDLLRENLSSSSNPTNNDDDDHDNFDESSGCYVCRYSSSCSCKRRPASPIGQDFGDGLFGRDDYGWEQSQQSSPPAAEDNSAADNLFDTNNDADPDADNADADADNAHADANAEAHADEDGDDLNEQYLRSFFSGSSEFRYEGSFCRDISIRQVFFR